jgi:hypothetical protein
VKEVIGILAAVLGFVAYAPYLRDIRANRAKPHPYSWFVWGLTSVVIFAIQISHGAGAGSYTTATIAFIAFFICVLSYFKHGKVDITLADTVLFVAALVATALWIFAREPLLSMILLSSSDLLGIGPSLRKAWNKPHEETLSMWGLNAFRHALSLLALQQYSLITVLNPAVWIVGNTLFSFMLIYRGRKLKLKLLY